MADVLNKVPDVEIDSDGKFKYILVRLKVKDGEAHKDIVRGTKSAEFHSKCINPEDRPNVMCSEFVDHIFEKVNPAMQALGLECVCLGGGRIEHSNQEKKLRVFGESTGYGKADHAVTVEKLKPVFKDYEITWSDDKK